MTDDNAYVIVLLNIGLPSERNVTNMFWQNLNMWNRFCVFESFMSMMMTPMSLGLIHLGFRSIALYVH